VVRLNLKNFRAGDRYYTYTLTGTAGVDFSRKVFVNGIGNTLVAGGPADYESIKANSVLIGDEIRVKTDPLSVTFILVEPGTKELVINNEVTSVEKPSYESTVSIYPNPASDGFTVTNIPPGTFFLEIKDVSGRAVYTENEAIYDADKTFIPNLLPGVYLVTLEGKSHRTTKKLIIK
jgi:hypothetical protein